MSSLSPQNLAEFTSLMLDESGFSVENTLISYFCIDTELGNSHLSAI